MEDLEEELLDNEEETGSGPPISAVPSLSSIFSLSTPELPSFLLIPSVLPLGSDSSAQSARARAKPEDKVKEALRWLQPWIPQNVQSGLANAQSGIRSILKVLDKVEDLLTWEDAAKTERVCVGLALIFILNLLLAELTVLLCTYYQSRF